MTASVPRDGAVTDRDRQTAAARPAGVPAGARLVTLAQLADQVAKEHGSLRLGPRGSYLRARIQMWPFIWIGVATLITHGVSQEHGGRVFGLRWTHGRRGTGQRVVIAFTGPGSADQELWIWTLADEASR